MFRLVAITFAITATIPLATGCDRGANAGGAPPGAGQPRGAPRAYTVTVETARTERLTYEIEALGQLEAEEQVEVAAEVEGVLGTINFREGDQVAPETVLVEVDPIRYRLEVDRYAAAVSRTAADLREKEAQLERRKSLRGREQGWVPEEEILRFEAEVAESRAALAEARAQADLARHDLARSRVRPPIQGEIERRHVNAGQWVTRGTVVATIVKRRPLRLKFTLTEEESAKVRAGQPATFRVPAYGDEAFRGEVFFVARTANPRTRRIECLAAVPNEDGRLKPGFFARVTIESETRDDAVLIPETSVIATEKGFVAYVVDDAKRARRRILDVGLRTASGRVEVRSGIAPGDTVVVRGAGLLDEGVLVAIESAK